MITGYGAAIAGMAPSLVLMLLGICLAVLSFFYAKKKQEALWLITFTAGAFCLSVFYYGFLNPETKKVEPFPPREAIATIKINRLFDTPRPYPNLSAIGTIETIEPFFIRHLEGQKIYLSLHPGKKENTFSKDTIIETKGVIQVVEKDPNNRGFLTYLKKSGIPLMLSKGKVIAIKKAPSFLARGFQSINHTFSEALEKSAPEKLAETVNTYKGMLLGQKAQLSQDKKTAFAQTGTMHLFAVSGLHVGVIALNLAMLLQILRTPKVIASALGIILLYIYVESTGGSPSAMRAFLMVAFIWAAWVVRKQSNPVTALIASAVLVLMIWPDQIRHPGLQLSYAVVGGILLYGLPLSNKCLSLWTPFEDIPDETLSWWQKIFRKIYLGLLTLLSTSFAAFLFSTPLTIEHFQIFSPGSLILNCLLIPLAGLVITIGFLSITFGIIHLGLISGFINHGAWIIIKIMEWSAQSFATVPGVYHEKNWNSPVKTSLVLALMFLPVVFYDPISEKKIAWALALPPLILLGSIII